MRYYIREIILGTVLMLCFWAIIPLKASSFHIGAPQIRHFGVEEHNGGTQTWDIEVSNGYVFFGNNDGLLVYDGNHFYKAPLPNATIVRSVEVIGNKFYVGGQSEFGYFQFLQDGHLSYHSLITDVPSNTRQTLTDIWSIQQVGDTLFFQSDHSILGFHHDSLALSITISPTIIKTGVFEGDLYWYTGDQKLYTYSDEGIVEVEDLRGETAITPTFIGSFAESPLLLATLDDGLFYLSDEGLKPYFELPSEISTATIYTVVTDSERMYVGTSRNGVYVLNKSGEVIQHYSIKNGLQNNNVLSLAPDNYGNIWTGLDRGIDFIPLSSPFRFIYPDAELRGTGYAALLHNNVLYLGTNNGLYSYNLTTPNPEPSFVKNSTGQVWRVQAIGNEVYVSHHRGLFQVVNEALEPISPTTGSWLLLPYPGTDLVVEGTYEGLNLYQETPSGLRYRQHLNGFNESSRYLAIKGNTIWVAHPYKGLFKLTISSYPEHSNIQSIKHYNGDKGLGTDLGILTFQLNQEVVFTGNKGIYSYKEPEDSFYVHPEFAPYFDSTNKVLFLTTDESRNIWFIGPIRVGYLDIQETNLSKKITENILPKLPAKVTGGFEFLLPLPNAVITPVEEGFIETERGTLAALSEHNPIVQFNILRGFGRKDTTIFLGYDQDQTNLTLPVGTSSIEIDFTVDNKALADLVQFQWRLEGVEDSWSKWTSNSQILYRYIDPGSYNLEVRCKLMGRITLPTTLAIEILKPWYKSRTALILFIIATLLILTSLAVIPSIRFRLAKRQMEYSQAKEIRQRETQFRTKFAQTQEKIDQLEAEKMQSEINHQAKELASATMHLVQKGEMLNKIKENLTEANKLIAAPEAKKQIRKVIRTIESDVNFDETWKNFEHQFDKVHVNFSKRIKDLYPQLTPNDIKLCTYLKLNLSSKEIAALTNISVRGVEISRYRLRKKLELDSNENLVEFIQEI